MRPVALLLHDQTQQPGFLLEYLNEVGIPTERFMHAEGGLVPRTAREFSGIALLGSERSVNDDLPWIEQEIALVKDAMATDIPVLGHCFGAQLIAKSLGATVSTNDCPNIGWIRLRVTPYGRRLFDASEIMAFSWHYETFSIPDGARRLLTGPHCLNKAFAIGKHLAFQCHFEVTEDIVRQWCQESGDELAQAGGPSVQSSHDILSQVRRNLPRMQEAARRIYAHWTSQFVDPGSLTTTEAGKAIH